MMKYLIFTALLRLSFLAVAQKIPDALNGNYVIPDTIVAESNKMEIEKFSIKIRSIYEEVLSQGKTPEERYKSEIRRLSFSFDIRDSRDAKLQEEIEKQFNTSRFFYFDKEGKFLADGDMPFGNRIQKGRLAISDNVLVPYTSVPQDIIVYLAFQVYNSLSGKNEVYTLKIDSNWD